MGVKLIASATYLPEKTLTNFDLEKMVETSDEWIRQRTGLVSRRIADDSEEVWDLALEAGKKCLTQISEADKNRIKLLIVATSSNLRVVPHVSSMIVEPLGLPEDILAFDLSAGCAGFVYSLSTVIRFLREGELALIIGSEKLSSYVDYTDRSTCILFGDGAGATIWEYSDEVEAYYSSQTITNSEVLYRREDNGKVHMDGADVFKYAVKNLPNSIEDLTKKAGIDIEEIDLFLLHQANERIITSVGRHLGLDQERFPVRFAEVGNTSAASVPILIDQLWTEGLLEKANNILISGFGAGFSIGSVLLKGNNNNVVKSRI
ncbi:MAG: beta-ketoacyl-ACP synthase 3 [Clostridiaceae bacterium]|nr:beta-ketoacyl-ACP synthase 3 [Clostridiaceae bacterium]